MLRTRKISLLALVLAVSLVSSMKADRPVSLVINELMASNSSCIQDPQGQFDDWIEIYNYGPDEISIGRMYLTDDLTVPTRWRIPSGTTIPAGGYLLIWADNDTDDTGLHANFRLDDEGEVIGFFDIDGSTLIDSVNFGEKTPDVSYGRYPDAEDYWRFFGAPSPGEENIVVYEGFVSDVQFSHNRGFYDTPFSVTIATETEGATIYYTLDGSEPLELIGRDRGGTVYTAPIPISGTTCLRAAAIKPGWMHSKIETHTYLFLEDVITQPNDPPGYPLEWGPYCRIQGTAIADYEMDPEITENPEYASLMKEALLSIPTMSIVTDKDNLFSKVEDPETGGIYIFTGPPVGDVPGEGWERPVSFEFFNADGSKEFQVDCGIRLQGGHSRLAEKSPKHSFRLVFKSKYGPSKFRYPLFGDDATTVFNTITLRAGFCNSWHHHSSGQRNRAQYIRDTWAKDTQLDIGNLSGHGLFVHLYLNGIYWGLYNPTERIDREFAASYYSGDDADFDVIKDYTEVVDGEISAWNRMMSMANAGLASNEAYQRIQGNNPDGTPNPNYEALVDVVNLIDYMILNFYGGNTDWDHHNWIAVRSRVNPGKGFQFFSWDAEHILESVNHNMLNENNNDCPSRLFQKLRENVEFRHLFADRVQLHCFNGGVLTPQSAAGRWMARAEEIDLAVIAESARWGDYRRDVHQYQTQGPFDQYTKNDHWLDEQAFLIFDYFPNRTEVLIKQLRDAGLYPDVDAPVFHINGSYQHGGYISTIDQLSMNGPGQIYYTLDGHDPRLTEASESSSTTLVAENDNKRVLVPNGSISNNWKGGGSFNDSSWLLCTGSPGGVGYEAGSGYENYISLDLEDQMYNGNTTCYIRIPFTVNATELAGFNFMALKVRYDDGFIAYINGVEVARRNFSGEPSYDSRADNTHSDSEAVIFESIDISSFLNTLESGSNILAIHGLNASSTSSDFLISVELIAGENILSNGGGISPNAIEYTGPITLSHSTQVKARALSSSTWSALNEATFAVGPVL